jgi:hypothetical protein
MTGNRLAIGGVVVQADLLVIDAALEPLREHIV